MGVGGFFGVTFGRQTLFQIEDIPKNGFGIILMWGSVDSLGLLLEVKPFFK